MHPIRRSASYFLLTRMVATQRLTLDEIGEWLRLGPEAIRRCVRAEDRLGLSAQWRLAALARVFWADDAQVARGARRLREQLVAHASFRREWPEDAPPDAVGRCR